MGSCNGCSFFCTIYANLLLLWKLSTEALRVSIVGTYLRVVKVLLEQWNLDTLEGNDPTDYRPSSVIPRLAIHLSGNLSLSSPRLRIKAGRSANYGTIKRVPSENRTIPGHECTYVRMEALDGSRAKSDVSLL